MEVGELITELLKCFSAALPSVAPSASRGVVLVWVGGVSGAGGWGCRWYIKPERG